MRSWDLAICALRRCGAKPNGKINIDGGSCSRSFHRERVDLVAMASDTTWSTFCWIVFFTRDFHLGYGMGCSIRLERSGKLYLVRILFHALIRGTDVTVAWSRVLFSKRS